MKTRFRKVELIVCRKLLDTIPGLPVSKAFLNKIHLDLSVHETFTFGGIILNPWVLLSLSVQMNRVIIFTCVSWPFAHFLWKTEYIFKHFVHF